MLGGSLLLFLLLFYFFPSPPIGSGEAFSSVIFPLFLFYLFLGCSDGMEREACVCDHGLERSDSCAEIIIIISTCHTATYCIVSRRIAPFHAVSLYVFTQVVPCLAVRSRV